MPANYQAVINEIQNRTVVFFGSGLVYDKLKKGMPTFDFRGF
jgi:hypothetical protein